jgi:hypothetical protein
MVATCDGGLPTRTPYGGLGIGSFAAGMLHAIRIRNRRHFPTAICFHSAGLDQFPDLNLWGLPTVIPV